ATCSPSCAPPGPSPAWPAMPGSPAETTPACPRSATCWPPPPSKAPGPAGSTGKSAASLSARRPISSSSTSAVSTSRPPTTPPEPSSRPPTPATSPGSSSPGSPSSSPAACSTPPRPAGPSGWAPPAGTTCTGPPGSARRRAPSSWRRLAQVPADTARRNTLFDVAEEARAGEDGAETGEEAQRLLVDAVGELAPADVERLLRGLPPPLATEVVKDLLGNKLDPRRLKNIGT